MNERTGIEGSLLELRERLYESQVLLNLCAMAIIGSRAEERFNFGTYECFADKNIESFSKTLLNEGQSVNKSAQQLLRLLSKNND